MELNLIYNKLIGIGNVDSNVFLAEKVPGNKHKIRLAIDYIRHYAMHLGFHFYLKIDL